MIATSSPSSPPEPSGPAGPAENRSFRIFMISVALAVAVCLSAVFLGMAVQYRSLIRDELLSRARVDFANIVMVRHWNASYGGVYVEKKPGMQSNPYLHNPDVATVDGRVLTKKNPALMTREVSEMQEQAGRYSFHITSLRPLNPANIPDVREAEALRAFERGEKERWWQEERDGRRSFRYMAPLYVDASCLQCHTGQGYRVGDVRGGISVRFDIESVEERLQRNLVLIFGLGMSTLGLLLAVIFYFFRKLVLELGAARRQLEILAATDALTGIHNRHHLMTLFEGEVGRQLRLNGVLGCVIFDLDRFKRINDRYGHQAGDEVLRQTARVVGEQIRPYDIFGRYGGEEFLLVLPGLDLHATAAVAERLRLALARQVRIPGAGDGESLTASFGVAQLEVGDEVGGLIGQADRALYRAKETGRNRVELARDAEPTRDPASEAP